MVKALPPHKLEVTIRVDGTPLVEYHDESATDSSESTVRYVECRDDENFEIAISVGADMVFQADALGCDCYVDGAKVLTRLISKEKVARGRLAHLIRGRQNGQTSLQPFRFRSLVIESETAARSDRADLFKDLGKIELIWTHRRITGQSHYKAKTAQEVTSVHEKEVKGKALSHATKYDKSQAAKAVAYHTSVAVGEPFLTFAFFYRAMTSLKASGIVPRTPSPEPLETRAIDSMSIEDFRQMQAELKRLKEQAEGHKRIKREGDHLDNGAAKRARPAESGTIFELNDDDSWIEKPAAKTTTPTSTILDMD